MLWTEIEFRTGLSTNHSLPETFLESSQIIGGDTHYVKILLGAMHCWLQYVPVSSIWGKWKKKRFNFFHDWPFENTKSHINTFYFGEIAHSHPFHIFRLQPLRFSFPCTLPTAPRASVQNQPPPPFGRQPFNTIPHTIWSIWNRSSPLWPI